MEYNHKSRLKPLSDVPNVRTVAVGICKLSFALRICVISWFCVWNNFMSYPGHTLDGLLRWVPWRTFSVMLAGRHRSQMASPSARTTVFYSHIHFQSFRPLTSHSAVSLSPGPCSVVPTQVLSLALLWVHPTPHSSEVSAGFPGFLPQLPVRLCSSLPSAVCLTHTGSGRALSAWSLWPQSQDGPQSLFSRTALHPGPHLGPGRERREAGTVPGTAGESEPESPEPRVVVAVWHAPTACAVCLAPSRTQPSSLH